MLPPLTEIPAGVVSTADYESLARERLSPQVWAYLSGGAADEITLRNNRTAFDDLEIVPRIFQELSAATTRLSLFGRDLAHPIIVAPTAFHQLFHPEGEMATVMGAAATDSAMVVSTSSCTSLEALASATTQALWFQLYIQPDREFTLELVHRARAAGYQSLVVTADAPLTGLRNREQRAGFQIPDGIGAVNLQGMRQLPPQNCVFGGELLACAPTWKDIAWLRSHTDLPIVIKGLLDPRDVHPAIMEGASAIIVSNHGGRTLDTAPASIRALPAIAAEVNRAIPILLDGGIRRGSDIFKALALGADAVMVGRPILHGLAAAGSLGVAHVLQILKTELEITMALAGCSTLPSIRTSSLLQG